MQSKGSCVALVDVCDSFICFKGGCLGAERKVFLRNLVGRRLPKAGLEHAHLNARTAVADKISGLKKVPLSNGRRRQR